MANKQYLIYKKSQTRKEAVNNFYDKMRSNYSLFEEHHGGFEGKPAEINIYDINNTATILHGDCSKHFPDLSVWGRPEDIEKTKSELEEKTGFTLEPYK